MQGQDFPIHVVPFVFEQLGAHDTFFSSSSSFTRTHTHTLSLFVSLFKQKRYVYVFYTRERDTKVLECVISFSAQLRATKKVGKSHSLSYSLLLKKCVCVIVLSSAALLVLYCCSSSSFMSSTKSAYSSSVGSGHSFSSK
jgi:hypothetical protein